ncbi:MAG: hypothetical protein M1819_004014 [Sarea resinae]|nr:MAG: hypothetical protein M1819_004014 [Sarea resinae]
MTAPKIFITGATGYIGGEVLHSITQAHPDYDITAFVRNSDKGAVVAAQYPKVRLVYGELDKVDTLEEEAKKADIVLHFADSSDHEPSATAIVKGVKAHSPDHPGFYIHTCGTGILEWQDDEHMTHGEHRDKIWDDWDNVDEVTSIPTFAVHRTVDEIVLAEEKSASDRLKLAIVCPPCIYGPGRGPGNKRSIQAYNMAKYVLKRKEGFQIKEGKNIWCQIHVQDLSQVYVRLVEEAVKGGGSATWGQKAYYFAENGEFVWGDVSQRIASIAHEKGFIPTDKVASLNEKDATTLDPMALLQWGGNSRCRAIRARKVLGWSPAPGRPTLFEELPTIVDDEAKALGLVTGHAKKVNQIIA